MKRKKILTKHTNIRSHATVTLTVPSLVGDFLSSLQQNGFDFLSLGRQQQLSLIKCFCTALFFCFVCNQPYSLLNAVLTHFNLTQRSLGRSLALFLPSHLIRWTNATKQNFERVSFCMCTRMCSIYLKVQTTNGNV